MPNTIAFDCRHGEMTGVDTIKTIFEYSQILLLNQILWKCSLTKLKGLYQNNIFANFCTYGYLSEKSSVFKFNFYLLKAYFITFKMRYCKPHCYK